MATLLYKSSSNSCKIKVKLQTRAKKNEIKGLLDDGTIKIAIAAVPVNGKANDELIGYLAKILFIKKDCINILVGTTTRQKILKIIGIDYSEIMRRIKSNIFS